MTQPEYVLQFLQSLPVQYPPSSPALHYPVWTFSRQCDHHELHSVYSGQEESTHEFTWMTNVHMGRSHSSIAVSVPFSLLSLPLKTRPIIADLPFGPETRAGILTNRPHGKTLQA